MGTQYPGSDVRKQQTGYTSSTAPLRWFEAANPATAQVNANDGLLMQAYTLSLTSFCR